MSFAEQIKLVRKKLYLSQQALAKELGVAFATINRWESNHVKPNLVMEAKFNDFCLKHNINFEEKHNAQNN